MNPKNWHPSVKYETAARKSRSKLVVLFCVSALLLLTIGTCAWLWHIEWLRPWLASFGTFLIALLGPIPGLLSPEGRSKWLILVLVAALIGAGTWYASKFEENQRDEARYDTLFSESLLKQLSPDVDDGLCKDVARPLQQLVLHREYQKAMRATSILRALRPANGHALYFEGEAYLGMKDYGEMLSAFRGYLYNADKDPAEAFEGSANDCYDRPSGYCGERTAWIEHLLANYFFARAQRSRGSEKIVALHQVVTEESYMMRARKIGFNADLTTRDTTDLLQETAEQLKGLDQPPNDALSLLAQVEEERRKARAK